MKNKESGVTLIVLVISIIVLLLIAGITINMAAKQVGIFKPKTHQGQSVVITNKVNTTNTTKNTVANTNTINNNLVKDKEELPKTGEFDVYIISVVAVVVVLVGGFVFVKSRKINSSPVIVINLI